MGKAGIVSVDVPVGVGVAVEDIVYFLVAIPFDVLGITEEGYFTWY